MRFFYKRHILLGNKDINSLLFLRLDNKLYMLSLQYVMVDYEIYKILGTSTTQYVLICLLSKALIDTLIITNKINKNKLLPTPAITTRIEDSIPTILEGAILIRLLILVPPIRNYGINRRQRSNKIGREAIQIYYPFVDTQLDIIDVFLVVNSQRKASNYNVKVL